MSQVLSGDEPAVTGKGIKGMIKAAPGLSQSGVRVWWWVELTESRLEDTDGTVKSIV